MHRNVRENLEHAVVKLVAGTVAIANALLACVIRTSQQFVTGTPEAGGLTSRELLAVLRCFADLDLVGADVVEVAPAYDHAEITGIAASHVVYDLVSAMAARR